MTNVQNGTTKHIDGTGRPTVIRKRAATKKMISTAWPNATSQTCRAWLWIPAILLAYFLGNNNNDKCGSLLASVDASAAPNHPGVIINNNAINHGDTNAADILNFNDGIDSNDGERNYEEHLSGDALIEDASSAIAADFASSAIPKLSSSTGASNPFAAASATNASPSNSAIPETKNDASSAEADSKSGSGGGWFGNIFKGGKSDNGSINEEGNGNQSDELSGTQQTAENRNNPQGNQLPPPPPPPPPVTNQQQQQQQQQRQNQPQPGQGEVQGQTYHPWMQQQQQPPPPYQQQIQHQNQRGQQNQRHQHPPNKQQPPQRQNQPRQRQQQQKQEPIQLGPMNIPYNAPPQPYGPNPNFPYDYGNTDYHTNTNTNYPIDPQTYQSLLQELDESTLREMTLSHQIQNLTSLVTSLTSESDTLLVRIDVLTERLADSESNTHFLHNRNLELTENCTALATLAEELRSELEMHRSKLEESERDKEQTLEMMEDLREELRRVTEDLETLACLVETERLEVETGRFLEDMRRKQLAKRKGKKIVKGGIGGKSGKHKKGKVGFWAWLFGFGGTGEDVITEEELEVMEEDERLRAAQELARSTLLHALQTERSNVDELEAAVATLQRNNSAIMDVVQSRNSLISELNDRVAVFEEDKMVLKAALRQLQKEIKEEAPKTQMLMESLEKAKENEKKLKEEMEKILLEAEEDEEMWQKRLEKMEKESSQTKEELELIGSYVDQLEDRLATFAIARKEIDAREKKCEVLEEEAKKNAKDAEEWKCRVEELTREQEETKPLLEELVKERVDSRVKIEQLTRQVQQMNDQIDEWKERLDEAEKLNEEIRSQSARQLFLKVEEEKTAWKQQTESMIQDEKQSWDQMKQEELRQMLERERMEWEATKSREWGNLVSQEKASWEAAAKKDYQVMLQSEQAALQSNLMKEWSAKMEQQRMEMETRLQEEYQRRLEAQRAAWEESKEQELRQRLDEERASWEASLPPPPEETGDMMGNDATQEEIERAAAKVYERLEQNGITFGVSDPSLDSVGEMFSSRSHEDIGNEVDDENVENTGEESEDPVEEVTDSGCIDEPEDSHRLSKQITEQSTLDSLVESEKGGKEGGKADSFHNTTTPSPSIVSSNATSPNATQPIMKRPPPASRGIPPRSVPFRSLRKAFSRVTGIHGVMTPSTVQLRQRGMRPRQLPPRSPDRNKGNMGSSSPGSGPQPKEASNSSSNQKPAKGLPPIPNRPPILSSQTGNKEFPLETNSWGNEFKERGDDITDEDFEWSEVENEGFEGSDDLEDDAAGASWSAVSQGGLGPPPLPDFED
mmetsp:Transcript_1125/g.2533  ORF Transcript_1125/g.2533 Transcript_1125/m.2533 type:complete len:1313 (-) Transcript_1125:57-3995(-)